MTNLNNQLVEHMRLLRGLTNRQYMFYLKYEQLKDYITKVKKQTILEIKNNIVTKEDLLQFIQNIQDDNFDEINIQIINVDSKNKKLLTVWTTLRKFLSGLSWNQNPGRNLKYLVTLNGKYLGVLSFGSDIISIGNRDKYIGWTKENKFNDKKLRSVAIGSSIVPTQPFGYSLTGGKFLSLLIYQKFLRQDWYRKYKDILVGVTTTSLFGNGSSQYQGMNKYWKGIGETKGLIFLKPSEQYWKKMRTKLKEQYRKQYDQANSQSGPKNKAINLYYRKYDFKKLWTQKTGMKFKDLNSCYKRGIYFARYYDNTLQYLRNQIGDDELIERSNLDYGIDDMKGLIKYWWKKYASKRIDKLDDTTYFLDTIYDVNDPMEFVQMNSTWKNKKFKDR